MPSGFFSVERFSGTIAEASSTSKPSGSRSTIVKGVGAPPSAFVLAVPLMKKVAGLPTTTGLVRTTL